MFLLLAVALRGRADQKMTARVSEEADAFLKLAPDVLGTETLHQRALKPPSRFHPRIGAAACRSSARKWNEREIVSEYGFASFVGKRRRNSRAAAGDLGGRQEGRGDQKGAGCARQGDHRRRRRAARRKCSSSSKSTAFPARATDFGQLLLLFTRRDLERYEFTARPPMMIGYDRALVWSYKQIDGPEALTLFERYKRRHMRVGGEIRVRATDFVPLQITLLTQEGDAPQSVREEAAVTYGMSQYGALLPSSTEHRELRGGKVVMENHFTYSDFHKFGASSGVTFPANK